MLPWGTLCRSGASIVIANWRSSPSEQDHEKAAPSPESDPALAAAVYSGRESQNQFARSNLGFWGHEVACQSTRTGHPRPIGSGRVRAELLFTGRRMLSFPAKESRSAVSEVMKSTAGRGTISARLPGRVGLLHSWLNWDGVSRDFSLQRVNLSVHLRMWSRKRSLQGSETLEFRNSLCKGWRA